MRVPSVADLLSRKPLKSVRGKTWLYALSLRVFAVAVCAIALTTSCMAQADGAFNVSVALWPTADFPVGSPDEIILAGQIKNESMSNAVWRGAKERPTGYGQVRVVGALEPLCETPRPDEQEITWEEPFRIGSSTPYRYEFRGLHCPGLGEHPAPLEARFCVNPYWFYPLPEPTCSKWVPITLDPKASALRDSDDVFRAKMHTFESTGDLALQERLLGALQLRALHEQPSQEEIKLNPVGQPNEALAELWLQFVKSEVAVMTALKPTGVPTMNSEPIEGCQPTQASPYSCVFSDPAKQAQYEKAEQRNDELITQWNHFRNIEDVATKSVADFGMWAGSQYRHNRNSREKFYAQATAMGVPEKQVSELRRFLEFVNQNQ